MSGSGDDAEEGQHSRKQFQGDFIGSSATTGLHHFRDQERQSTGRAPSGRSQEKELGKKQEEPRAHNGNLGNAAEETWREDGTDPRHVPDMTAESTTQGQN